MAFYDSIPASGNQVLTDVSQMQDSFAYLKSVFQNFCTTWDNSSVTGIAPKKFIRSAKTADYTVTAADAYLSLSGASAAVTLTLEAAATAGAGRFVMIKATDITNTVTVDGNGSETIDGSTTFVFTHTNQSICVISNGSNWEVLFNSVADLSKSVLGQNMLTNSGFGVWSNSDGPYNYGSALVDDDCADDDTGNWSTSGFASLVFDTDHYELSTNGGSGTVSITGLNFTAGHLYKISVQFKNGTASGATLDLRFYDGVSQVSPIITTTSSFVTHTFTIVCATTTASGYISIGESNNLGGLNVEIKNVTVYEITPGIESGTLGPDGWTKDVDDNIYRRFSSDVGFTAGSLHCIEVSPSAVNGQWYFPSDVSSEEYWLSRLRGRTVTFGLKGITATASHLKISIYDGSHNFSSYHTGGGSEEWLEITHTIALDATTIRFYILASNASGDYQVSCPMAILGNSIGEGNYQAPVGEVIILEDMTPLVSLDNVSGWSDVSLTEINIQAETFGKMPHGVRSITLYSDCRDSGSASDDCYLYFRRDSGQVAQHTNSIGGITNDTRHRVTMDQACDENGNIDYAIGASGSGTFDILECEISVVTLR